MALCYHGNPFPSTAIRVLVMVCHFKSMQNQGMLSDLQILACAIRDNDIRCHALSCGHTGLTDEKQIKIISYVLVRSYLFYVHF